MAHLRSGESGLEVSSHGDLYAFGDLGNHYGDEYTKCAYSLKCELLDTKLLVEKG